MDAYPVNEIAKSVDRVSAGDVNALVEEYYDKYEILLEGRDEKEFREHVAVQAGIESKLAGDAPLKKAPQEEKQETADREMIRNAINGIF